ncbi:O-methyltransferase-domain-containing protein [Lentinula raphanica]|nr:O-methyltransferase-domain-containing protein [Lentinula raphanica]
MPSPLRSLLTIIQKSVDDIEAAFEKRGHDFPSIDELPSERDSIRLEPGVQAATALLTSAAYQLIANVQLPPSYIFNSLFGYYLPSALRAAMETNVVEILRQAGPQGMHVKDIAEKAQVDPTKLSSILCYLATHHIFREISPNVYVNNRLSSVWDTEKSLEEIKQNPTAKFDGTNGIAALIGHCADEDYKGAGQISDHFMAPETAFEDTPERSPLMVALGYDKGSMWSWFEEPSNEMRLRRFGIAMNGVNSLQPPDAILKGFDWASLPEGSLVVDVGGGIGVSSISIARAFPHLKCIVQDRSKVIEIGTEVCALDRLSFPTEFEDRHKHCQKLLPDALSSGKIEYHEHDFFDAQPQTSSTVFLLKQITHDWSDRYVIRILKRLRDAATPTTTLVIVDTIINHPCPSPPSEIPGANLAPPPSPLLANLGVANASTHFADLSMFVHFNACERTLAHMVELLAGTGWEVTRVYRSDDSGGYLPQIVARTVPIPVEE